MNLEGVVTYSRHRVLTHKIIPLLCLIKQWSAQQDDAMLDTPCILYILQTLQKTLSKRETTLTLRSMLEDIKCIFSPVRFEEYETVLHTTCTDLSAFIEVFKDLKSLISSSPNGSTKDPLIDEKNGVIGGFIRHCVHEYQKMTFSQTVTLQREWNNFYNDASCITEPLKIRKKMNREQLAEVKQNKEYTKSMEKLMLPIVHHSSKSSSGTPVELKALHLAMLFTQFDHIDEGKEVLKETIRMARMTENLSVLEHSMALLQRFTAADKCSRSLITELIKHATNNKDSLLMSTGKLQLSKVEIQLKSTPIRVLDILLSTEFDIFTSYEDLCHKCSVRSSALLLRASLLRQYGLRYLSLLPLQLLCHLNEFEQDVSQHRVMDDTRALSLISLTLSEEGRLTEAIAVIERGIHHLSSYDKIGDSKFLSQCLLELKIQKLFRSDDLRGYSKYVKQLAVFDSPNAYYWEIKSLIHFKQLSAAREKCNRELAKSIEEMDHSRLVFQARYLLLLVEIYTKEYMLSRAMDAAIKCLIFSQEYQLWDIVMAVKLRMANLQLYLGLVSSSKETIQHVLPIIMAHGQRVDKVLAFFIFAQISLMENKKLLLPNNSTTFLPPSDIQEGFKYLHLSLDEEAVSSLSQTPLVKKLSAFRKLLCDLSDVNSL